MRPRKPDPKILEAAPLPSAPSRRHDAAGSDCWADDDADRAENEGCALGRPTPREQGLGAP